MTLLVVFAGACTGERTDAPTGLPGLTENTAPLEPGTLAPGDQSYVDALARNFEEGGRLVAQVDEPQSACLAERWVGLIGTAALTAASIPAERLADITLAELRAVGLSRRQAQALVASFGACEVDHTVAFLDSLLLTSQITPPQRVCLEQQLPDDLIDQVTVAALVDDQVDPDLTAGYQRALDACPAS